jgi:hypothetical protein
MFKTHKSYYGSSTIYGKKFLLRHFFGQVLNRNNPSIIRFCLLEFKITSNLEKYFCGFIRV